MLLPLEHQSRLSDTSVGVKCPPNSGDSKKLNGSPSRTRTTRPTKNAKDGTSSERRTDVGNAEVHHSVAENREQDGTQVGDDMDTVGTNDDEKETDNENNAANGNSEWSIFSKRKPNRKVKPDQFRLEREYQELLEADEWHNTCAKLGREPGLRKLWVDFEEPARKKGPPPLAELLLREQPTSSGGSSNTNLLPSRSGNTTGSAALYDD
ncbi:hypothetical protein HPB50_027719 [Hyalomma asiaticum]|nr:hypothetical protein HPB50_027719 [Hyalomma asiaticum]